MAWKFFQQKAVGLEWVKDPQKDVHRNCTCEGNHQSNISTNNINDTFQYNSSWTTFSVLRHNNRHFYADNNNGHFYNVVFHDKCEQTALYKTYKNAYVCVCVCVCACVCV